MPVIRSANGTELLVSEDVAEALLLNKGEYTLVEPPKTSSRGRSSGGKGKTAAAKQKETAAAAEPATASENAEPAVADETAEVAEATEVAPAEEPAEAAPAEAAEPESAPATDAKPAAKTGRKTATK